jgi:hypothetical protein
LQVNGSVYDPPIGASYFGQMRTLITPGSSVLAFGISSSVGLVFGLHPSIAPRTWTPSNRSGMNDAGGSCQYPKAAALPLRRPSATPT